MQRSALALALAGAVCTAAPASAMQSNASKAKAGNQVDALLYVWDNAIPGNDSETKKLIKFARQRGFTALAIEASPVAYDLPGADARYFDFVERANKRGIDVYALIGYQWFTVSPDAALPGQPTSHLEAFAMVQELSGSNLFEGVLDDSQPYLVNYDEGGVTKNYLFDQTQVAAQDYLDYLAGIQQFAPDLRFIKAVPFWFDSHDQLGDLYLDGSNTPHSLAWYTAQYVDVMNVLAYRDEAFGPGEILELAKDELKFGSVMVGVETQDRGANMDFTTFWEEGWVPLVQEVNKVHNVMKAETNYAGVSVHHYGSASQMGTYGPPTPQTAKNSRDGNAAAASQGSSSVQSKGAVAGSGGSTHSTATVGKSIK